MAYFGFYRYCELAIDEEKLASHFIENPSFQHIHHSVEVLVFYYIDCNLFQFVSRMSAYCLQKKVRFGHVQKLRDIF